MSGLPDPAASRVVLIGAHSYHHLEDLPAVERNLAGLRQVLTDPSLWGLPEANYAVVEQPENPRQVLDRFRHVATQATDTLVVYYSGHGLADPYTDELCLTLPDSDPALPYTTLRYEDLRRLTVDPVVRAKRKIVILDCCYSGRALPGGMSAGEQVADQAVVQGSYLLTASAETRKALAPPGERYTAFTGELIQTLSQGVPGGPDLLDMDIVYRRLHTALAAKSRPLPQQRNRNTGGLIALVRNAARASRPGQITAGNPEPVTSNHPLRRTYTEANKLAAVTHLPDTIRIALDSPTQTYAWARSPPSASGSPTATSTAPPPPGTSYDRSPSATTSVSLPLLVTCSARATASCVARLTKIPAPFGAYLAEPEPGSPQPTTAHLEHLRRLRIGLYHLLALKAASRSSEVRRP